jgi:hypothetical protein
MGELQEPPKLRLVLVARSFLEAVSYERVDLER